VAKQHVIFSLSSGQYDAEVIRIASEAGVPLLLGMREALAAIAHTQRCSNAIARLRPPEDLAGPEQAEAARLVRQAKSGVLGEHYSKGVLAAAGIATTREYLAATPEDAVRAANELGYPVALKVDSADIPHKTEAGCVKIGLGGAREVAGAFETILANARRYRPDARIDGVLVQEMVHGGVETLLGVVCHEGLAPVLVFGLGGVAVEALQDRAMRAVPLAPEDAAAVIAETRAARLLHGWRGGPPLDAGALEQALVRVSQLAWQLRELIAEIDINPLVVLPHGQGVKALDALIVRAYTQLH
jgi:acetyltransferase